MGILIKLLLILYVYKYTYRWSIQTHVQEHTPWHAQAFILTLICEHLWMRACVRVCTALVQDPRMQANLALLLFGMSFATHIVTKPYVRALLNLWVCKRLIPCGVIRMWLCLIECACLCVHIHMYMYVNFYICVCVFVCIYIHTRIYMYTRIYIHTRLYTHAHIQTRSDPAYVYGSVCEGENVYESEGERAYTYHNIFILLKNSTYSPHMHRPQRN